jgi:hypothetical protein
MLEIHMSLKLSKINKKSETKITVESTRNLTPRYADEHIMIFALNINKLFIIIHNYLLSKFTEIIEYSFKKLFQRTFALFFLGKRILLVKITE